MAVTPTFGPELTLEQAIQQAVGAASMCWATPEGAGLFQEERARAIADDLIAGLREGRWTEPAVGVEAFEKLVVERLSLLRPSESLDVQARVILGALAAAGAQFPSGRPETIEEHILEAERLLALAYLDNDEDHAPGGYYNGDEYGQTCVAAAEVHARIAHALAAAGLMVSPAERRELTAGEEPSPGMQALTRLSDAMDRIAAAWERDQADKVEVTRAET